MVDYSLEEDNSIHVIIDSVQGVKVEDLVKVNRFIESSFDREEEDFSVKVASPGLDQPLVLPKQYIKNIGRKVEVKTQDGRTITAKLEEVSESGVSLSWKSREPKPIGKGKHTVEHSEEIPFEEIVETKVVITF